MMVPQILLETLKSKGITLNLDKEDNLKVRGKSDKLTNALTEQIKENKQLIIQWLKNENQRQLLNKLKQPIVKKAHNSGSNLVSFEQQSNWMIDWLEGDSAHYNITRVFRLLGALDLDAFERAFYRISERHEVLRAQFQKTAVGITQKICELVRLPMDLIDIRELSKTAQRGRLDELIEQEIKHVYHLDTAPLFRIKVVRLNENEHAVMFNVHHIIFDGLSMEILVSEFIQLYNAFSKGELDPLPPLNIQYADYAIWQRESLTGDMLKMQLEFWRKQLSAAPHLHSIPLDKKRLDRQDYNGANHSHSLSPDIGKKIRQICESQNTTTFVFIQSVFALLLSRYSNENNILIGTPYLGRNHKDTEKLIGMFFNTMVLRSDLSGNPTFLELLNQNKKYLTQAMDYQYLPFSMIVDDLKVSRSPAYNPLVQIFLNFTEVANSEQLGLSELTIAPLGHETITEMSKADITLYCHILNEQIRFDWLYKTSLFKAETINSMATSIKALIEQICTAPDKRINEYSLMLNNNLAVALCERKSAVEQEIFIAVHEQIRQMSKINPTKPALCHGDTVLNYGELEEKSAVLAAYLIRHHRVSPGDIVGLCVERGPAMVIGILAILKTGAAYAPMNPEFPKARLDYIVRDTGMKLVLGDLIQFNGITCHNLDEEPQYYIDVTLPAVQADHISHIIYTSGSTGQPKGVMGTHGSLANRISWMQNCFAYETDEVACHITPISFIRAVWELFAPLTAAKCVVISDIDSVKSPDRLFAHIKEKQISRLVTAPSLAKAMLLMPVEELKSLKYWFISGERLESRLARQLQDKLPAVKIVNLYGSTEVMSDVTYFEFDACCESEYVPIGKTIKGNQVVILDDLQRLVPSGVPGEIYVCGKNLAKGYLNKPELTEEKFVNLVLNEHSSLSLFRTGDYGRITHDGNIEYICRRDHQIKLRGYRIELSEIEYHLNNLPEISSSVVLFNGDSEFDRALIAFVMPKDLSSDLWHENYGRRIQSMLSKFLPNYMIPNTVKMLRAFPLLENGKIDRVTLSKTKIEETKTNITYRNETERTISEIWGEVLKIDSIDVYEDFYQLGGNSLLMIEVFSHCKKNNLPLKIKELTMYRNVASLSAYIDREVNAKEFSFNKARSDLNGEEQCLVKLNEGNSQGNIFCIHPIGGTVLCYAPLAAALENFLTVYAIQSRDIFEGIPMISFESLAAYYAELILSVQKKGPFHLVGYSLGGKLMYEVACQLKMKGHEVAYLALLDARAYQDNNLNSENTSWINSIRMLHEGQDLGVDWETVSKLSRGEGIEQIIRHLHASQQLLMIDIDLFRRYLNYLCDLDKCLQEYKPTQSDINIDLFQVALNEHQLAIIDALPQAMQEHRKMYDWTLYSSGEIVRCYAGGTHRDMLKTPHVEMLSSNIRERLSAIIKTKKLFE
jgi:amino acid adenylation domain-containing protein